MSSSPPVTNEETPLVLNQQNIIISNKPDLYAKYTLIAGLGLFVALIMSVLVRIPFTIFTYHPFFMTLFVVFVTEGISILQPANTAQEKKKRFQYHVTIQLTSSIFAILGFSFIFYNKIISKKSHFESLHSKLGLFVFICLFIQVLFGISITFLARPLLGSVDKGKRVWRYHRIYGYVLLLPLVWITAQLGVRTDYIYNHLYSSYLIYFHWLAVILIFCGVYYRVRFYKLKAITTINVTQQ